jgi:hypothetical protein
LGDFLQEQPTVSLETGLMVKYRTNFEQHAPALKEGEWPVSSLCYMGADYDQTVHGNKCVTVWWYAPRTATTFRRTWQITLDDAAVFGHPAAVGGSKSWICQNTGKKSSNYGAGQGQQLTGRQADEIEAAKRRVDAVGLGVYTLPTPGEPVPRFNSVSGCALLAFAIRIGATTAEIEMFLKFLQTSDLSTIQNALNNRRKKLRRTSFRGLQLETRSFDRKHSVAEILHGFRHEVLLVATRQPDKPAVHVVCVDGPNLVVYDPAFPYALSIGGLASLLEGRTIVEVRALVSNFQDRPDFVMGAFTPRLITSSLARRVRQRTRRQTTAPPGALVLRPMTCVACNKAGVFSGAQKKKKAAERRCIRCVNAS